jgi:hypothetical protein
LIALALATDSTMTMFMRDGSWQQLQPLKFPSRRAPQLLAVPLQAARTWWK